MQVTQRSPHTLEAIEVEGGHLATVSITQAKDGRMRSRDAVGVLIDQ